MPSKPYGYRRNPWTQSRLERMRNRLMARSILRSDESVIRSLARVPTDRQMNAVENQVFHEFGVIFQQDFEKTATALIRCHAIGIHMARVQHIPTKRAEAKAKLDAAVKDLDGLLNYIPRYPVDTPALLKRFAFLFKKVFEYSEE